MSRESSNHPLNTAEALGWGHHEGGRCLPSHPVKADTRGVHLVCMRSLGCPQTKENSGLLAGRAHQGRPRNRVGAPTLPDEPPGEVALQSHPSSGSRGGLQTLSKGHRLPCRDLRQEQSIPLAQMGFFLSHAGPGSSDPAFGGTKDMHSMRQAELLCGTRVSCKQVRVAGAAKATLRTRNLARSFIHSLAYPKSI